LTAILVGWVLGEDVRWRGSPPPASGSEGLRALQDLSILPTLCQLFAHQPAMASPKKRIPLNGPQAGLNNAFAQLHLEGLPEGPPPQEGGVLGEAAKRVETSKPGRVVLRRLSAHRGGKTVLLVDGFGPQHSESALEELGRRLRAQLGCGGTCRGRALEIQGDQPARLRSLLESEGFQVAGER
jgi:translation initiation factor 1